MNYKSYLGKQFTIIDNEARVRRDDDIKKAAVFELDDELPAGSNLGDFKVIPKRTIVTVSDVKVDDSKNTFVFAQPVDAPPGTPSGWTKATNLEGGLLNETVGLAPSQWALAPQGKNRTVTDRNALVRDGAPDFKSKNKSIPAGTFVLILEESSGTNPPGRFVRVCGGEIDGESFVQGEEIGWTSVSNLSDGCADFYTSAGWADQRGPNACWDHGQFVGQKLLVNIIGTGGELEQITLETMGPYFRLVGEAAKENLQIGIESAFRTFAKQKQLFDGFRAKKPGFNLAAAPGRSNHQHGQAFDLNTRGFDGNPVYDWLKRNGARLGFVRTVNKEHWHWEYLPVEAVQLAKRGKFKRANVAV
ncbi:MAG: zinc D-Ala-D-Ala carboxypeptidase [Acidobacteriota bacterium]|jgi:hypothetical protein|nr:zinc D-Ala-D-Ala carboxypeptidase [Acidobacteriota bacterium]